MAAYCWSTANYTPAMSFEEIGERLGMPKQRIYEEYQRALNKLAQSPEIRDFVSAVLASRQTEYPLSIPRRRNRGCA